ncbi:putative polysaccharide biosynthesis protein [Alkaliphilus serpentinus]|uniref:Polysaccharide biosynthesis protein n=1 Tax=Alkaliphilus serpentinus TaxID=1482731 RepID=A0A833M6Z2_9FIRM|nr:polysaccharide biosynthesis protein [Alkaliphilus serpentinus]KAB3525835.1 polysaccharide biosynthesis protein [Alkaliphilus serpentinus]
MSSKKLIKGAFILAIAGLMAKFLGIFFKIPLQRLIHDEGMGIFGLPYPVYTLLLAVSIIGFPAAISKLISEKLAVGNIKGARKVFKISFLLLFFTGLTTSIMLYKGAPIIIKVLDWPEETYYAIIGLSFAPFFVSIMSAFRGYFQGFQLMTPTAISQIIEQMGRVTVGVGLAYFLVKKGTGVAAGGASFGATAGAFLGAIVLCIYYLKYRRTLNVCNYQKGQWFMEVDSTWVIVKRVVWLALPITVGAILASVMGLIDSIIVHSSLLDNGYTVEGATILYGRLTGKAVTLMNVPLTFSMAMAASIVPAISESFSKKRLQEVREKAAMGIRITIIIALPAAVGLSILSHQIIHLLWGPTEMGGEILKILALNVLFISLAQTMTGILQGLSRVFTPVGNLLIGVVVKWGISTYLLATHLNIIGTVIGTIVGYFIIMTLNYLAIKRRIGLKLRIMDTIVKPIVSSAIMAAMVIATFRIVMNHLNIEAVATMISIFVGMGFYLLALFLLGGINLKEDRFFLK